MRIPSPPAWAITLLVAWSWLAGAVMGWAAPPRPRPGWRISLVAEAPVVRHPTVVATAPDGRVFVAEDPMDIARPAQAAEGRILCLHPGGRWTVFAERLHAVFGMQYLEGRLYVLHNPRFSVFRDDDGVGRDREELVDQTNPSPWALDWNDHVPANFRLGLDGFFHVAVGDKGLFRARGRDGRTVSLQGGGMVRIRPDGTGLEVFATGVRNILDVAGTAEDDWFTYDNTDEHEWMGRLTHMVEGGFYGYPFDFIPRRPYTLWMMADYGAGAATGVACALGDALPPDHRGNLFLADFGQRNVRRVVLGRDGATFRALHDENLFLDAPADFRPVGMAFTEDNSALYVCDWQHRDHKEEAVVGRLWKLEREAPGPTLPIPAWHVAHGHGRPAEASVAELAGALSHPVHAVRLSAQRMLARRGSEALPALVNVLADARLGDQARVHALWALDAMDGGRQALAEVVRAARSSHPAVARQALRQMGPREHPEARPVAESILGQAPHPSVAMQAAITLGRVGDEGSVPVLVEALGSPDLFVRHAAFQALRAVGLRHPGAWWRVVGGLGHSSARVREHVVFAFRDAHAPQLVRALAAVVVDAAQPEACRAEALRALAPLHRQRPPWNGDWWAYHPFRIEPPPRTVEWAGTPDVVRAIRLAAADPSVRVRAEAASALGELPVADGGDLLLGRLGEEADASVRARLVASLARVRPPAASRAVVRMLGESRKDSPLPSDAVALARALLEPAVLDALGAILREGDARDRRLPEVIRMLGEARASNVVAGIVGALDLGEPLVRDAAIEAIRVNRWREGVPGLLRLVARGEAREPAIAALMAMPDARAAVHYLDAMGGRDARLRAQGRAALAAVREEAWAAVAGRLDGLMPEVVGDLQRIYRGHAGAVRDGLMSRESRRVDPMELMEAALAQPGDVARGRALFQDPSGLACLQCHRVQGQGNAVGPDLSGVGAQLDARGLAESILWPGKTVREGYGVIHLELADGESISGMIRSETTGEVVLQPAAGGAVVVPKERIRGRRASGASLMPDGLGDGLTPEGLADLLAYLRSLRSGS